MSWACREINMVHGGRVHREGATRLKTGRAVAWCSDVKIGVRQGKEQYNSVVLEPLERSWGSPLTMKTSQSVNKMPILC